MFLHLYVSHSVHRGGGCLADIPQADTPPLGRHPPGQTSPGRHPPPRAETPPGCSGRQRTVRILLECILVFFRSFVVLSTCVVCVICFGNDPAEVFMIFMLQSPMSCFFCCHQCSLNAPTSKVMVCFEISFGEFYISI